KEGLSIDLPSANARVIEPTFVEGLPDEGRSFEDAVRQPLGGRPLRETVKASDRVAVVIPDITRPLPTDRLLRWILAELTHVAADRRIVLGFIEPHFMAGFSGGYKGVFPAIADIDSIMHYHRAQVIGDPRSTWGVLDGNPTQEQIRWSGALLPVDFLVNLTQNRKRQITRFFCGEVTTAHRQGCAFAKSTAMVPCPAAFPIVVTTNAGYPLDQ